MRTSRLPGFKHRYPQKFLDELAKTIGFEWTKVEFKTIPRDEIKIQPLPPPSGKLNYIEIKYK